MRGILADTIDQLPAPHFISESLWRYVLLTEVLRNLGQGESRLLYGLDGDYSDELIQLHREFEEDLQLDFSRRLASAVDRLGGTTASGSRVQTREEIDSILHTIRIDRLERRLSELARDYPIHFVFDGLDRSWSVDQEASVELLHGLVRTIANLGRSHQNSLRFTLFLRQEVYSLLETKSTDLELLGVSRIEWTRELLLELVAARLRYIFRRDDVDDEEAWNLLFPTSIGSVDALDYILRQTLMRPRELLGILQSAMTIVVNHRKESVSEDDLVEAVDQVSAGFVNSICVEYQDVYPDLFEVLAEFGDTPPSFRGTISSLSQAQLPSDIQML